MSKKKAFSGSIMTLKDFHGGSIPSDIPLPSAPGVVVRPSDRPGFDRPSAWGDQIGRSEQRLRPNSSGSMRTLDEKTPFLSNSANIGRHFDEDERKPLDGVSCPRRTVSDDSVRPAPPMRSSTENKQEAVGRFSGQQSPSPRTPMGSVGCAGSYTRAVEGGHMVAGARPLSGGGVRHNAWGVRKEPVGVTVTASSPWTGQSPVAKFSQASALDKVSSGRWQTKPSPPQADVEVIRQSDSPTHVYNRRNDFHAGRSLVSEKESYEMSLARQTETSLTVDEGIRESAKEVAPLERTRSPAMMDGKEKVYDSYGNGGQAAIPDSKIGASHVQPPAEPVERTKLKLLPRTKPLSPPVEQAAVIVEKPRVRVFGGARPREMVLKERGADDNPVNNQNPLPSQTRVKNDSPRSDPAPTHANSSRYSNRAESVPLDHRAGKGGDRREQRTNERREQRVDAEKNDTQRKSWRNENWRSGRDAEKHHQHQQERQRSPETWRKPVEQPKPGNGKSLSAVELAQAFSGSVSDSRSSDQFSVRRGASGRPQIPFSRLMGTSTRPQINGY